MAAPENLSATDLVTIVIEGDGEAHDRRGRPTDDPTPRRLGTGLEIAQSWPGDHVVSLGRLCQHTRNTDLQCSVEDWTTGRFSAEAVAATNAAIDEIRAMTGARRVRLVGWSGGGVMATLVAQRRVDVDALVTFAAPLDTDAWTRALGLSALDRSLNPAEREFYWPAPQIHLLGRFDGTVPAQVMAEATRGVAGPDAVVEIRRQRHECCWTREIGFALENLPAP